MLFIVTGDNVLSLLPLVREYQVTRLLEKIEEFLLSEPNSIQLFLVAQDFDLHDLKEANMAYIKRTPITRYIYWADHQGWLYVQIVL